MDPEHVSQDACVGVEVAMSCGWLLQAKVGINF